MNLTEAESSFKALKSELCTRPLYHQIDSGIEAYILISVLANYLLRSITYELGEKDYHKSWNGIRDIMKMHIRTTISFCNRDGYNYHVRITGQPEKDMKELYDLLKIKINKHKKNQKNNRFRL